MNCTYIPFSGRFLRGFLYRWHGWGLIFPTADMGEAEAHVASVILYLQHTYVLGSILSEMHGTIAGWAVQPL